MHNPAMETELEKRMKLQGWTDETLAAKVGRHRSNISRLRRGEAFRISLEHATAISELTGVPVLTLLEPSKAKKTKPLPEKAKQ